MRKIFTYVLPIILLIVIIIPGFFVFPVMSIMLFIWIILIFAAHKYGYLKKLHTKERNWYFFVIITYPIIETFLKWMITANIIPYSWFWLNRVEHFLASLSIGFLFFPFLKQTIKKLNTFEHIIFWVSFVSIIGVGNEFFEFAIRHYMGIYKKSFYYWDTIYDMAINILGSIVGFLILKRIECSIVSKSHNGKNSIQRHNSGIKRREVYINTSEIPT